MHDCLRKIRHQHGNRRDIWFVVESYLHRSVGVMVWGAITYGSRSPLLLIPGGMAAIRYIGNILQITLLPYFDGRPYILFQQDNAHLHTSRRTMEFLQEAGANVLQ